MNRIHRLVWNAARRGWQAVCETAVASGKSGPGGAVRRGRAGSALLAFAAACTGSFAVAGPQGAQVVLGSGSVAQAGSTTTITQTTGQLAIDWQSFGVGAGETVRFVQPGAQSVALNRVLGAEPSHILGQLSANGQVFLLNPHGVLFGANARVDVGGLVASTLSLSNEDFAAGRIRLQGSGNAGVSNAGRITAAEGGYVVLAAPQVQNTGDITTRLGTTALAAGEHVTLQLQGGSLLGYRIDRGALDALVEQAGRVSADGGAVLIEAKALDALSSAVVNHSGISQARTVQAQDGRIVLLGDMAVGQVNLAGSLDASAPEGGDGGFIETSAAVVKVDDAAHVSTLSSGGQTGTWLIDRPDFTVAASGGGISGTALSAALANNNVTLDNNQGLQNGLGNLYVRDEVSWSGNRLTLRAQANIHIYRDLLGSGSAQLALEFGQATADGAGSDYDLHNASRVNLPEGRNFSMRQGSAGVTQEFHVVTRIAPNGVPGAVSYREISNDTAGLYALGADLSFDPNVFELKLRVGLEGQEDVPADFTGQFHGLGHTMTGLSVNGWRAGMFDTLGASAVARDFGLLGGNVVGFPFHRGASNSFMGAVAGYNHGLIYKVYATPQLFSRNATASGGLVGVNFGVIRQSFADPTGNTLPSTSNDPSLGSLVGINVGLVEDSFAYSRLADSPPVIGNNKNGDARRVYAINPGYQVIDNNVARNLDLAAMQSASSFAGWDIGSDADGDSIWRIVEGQSTPLLRDLRRREDVQARVTFNGQTQVVGVLSGRNAGLYAAPVDVTPLGVERTGALVIDPAAITVSSTDVSRGYDGTTSADRAQAQVVAGMLFGTDLLIGGRFAFADANAGTGKTVLVSGVNIADGNGGANYLLTLVDNTSSTITPAALQLRADPTSKTYDGNTDASTSWRLSGGRLYGSDSLGSVRFLFDGADAGTGKALLLGGAVLNDGNGGANYALTLAPNAASSIVPAELFVTANSDQRVEGAPPYVGGNGFTTRGWVAGENDGLLQGGVVYGGSSQGAVAAGSYSIAPGGLSSPNYRLLFENGTLVISALPVIDSPPVFPPPQSLPVVPELPALPALPVLPRLPDAAARAGAQPGSPAAGAIALVECGMRLPAGAPGEDCR